MNSIDGLDLGPIENAIPVQIVKREEAGQVERLDVMLILEVSLDEGLLWSGSGFSTLHEILDLRGRAGGDEEGEEGKESAFARKEGGHADYVPARRGGERRGQRVLMTRGGDADVERRTIRALEDGPECMRFVPVRRRNTSGATQHPSAAAKACCVGVSVRRTPFARRATGDGSPATAPKATRPTATSVTARTNHFFRPPPSSYKQDQVRGVPASIEASI
jgi:hypothetical protein